MNPRTLGDEKLYQSIFNATSDGILIADPETGSVLVANPAAAGMHGYPPRDFNHLNFYKLIHANSQTLFDEFPHIVQQGNQFDTLAQHVRMDGTVFTVEWRAVAMKHQNRTYALALLRDVTNRVQAERLLRQRVGARAREQTTLLEISQTLASTLELQPGLILDQLRGLINYSQAALFTMHDSTLVAEVVRGNEQLEKSVPIFIRLDGKESLETLLTIQKPIRVSDFSSSDPTMIILLSLLKDESPVLLEGVQSWMWVPLVVKSRILGVIYAAHTARNYFSPNHADLAMIIANQVAVALVNSELHERARVLAALEERQRLAQNLHDAVNQSLFSAGLIAEVLPRLWDRNPVEARRSLEDLRRLTRGAQAEMRALLAELRPSTLTDNELGDMLRLLGYAFTGRTNIPVSVSVSGEGSLPAETQVALYRISQEALNNVAKHAKATQVDITVRHVHRGLEIHIRDNGCGFTASDLSRSGHYGLEMIRERAEAVGAVLLINSQPGVGTNIEIYWGERED